MLKWFQNDRFCVLGRQYGAVDLREHLCGSGPKNQPTKLAGMGRHDDEIDIFRSGYIHNLRGCVPRSENSPTSSLRKLRRQERLELALGYAQMSFCNFLR